MGSGTRPVQTKLFKKKKKILLQASGQLKEIEKQLKEQYKHTSQTLELLADLLADLRYRDGIEEIEASFTAFWKGIKQYCR